MTKETELGDCIEFSGNKYSGYGVLSLNGVTIRAHRLAFKLANPSVILTPKKNICHKCDNPSCINPKHLFIGTNGDNNKDRHSKGRDAVGEKHGRSKLKSADVVNIRKMKEDGFKLVEIAKKFNVHPTMIGYIVQRRYWK